MVTVQYHPVVTPQVHAHYAVVGYADKAELVDTGDDTCKHTRLWAVMVLFVVDDLMEMDDSV